MTDFLGRELHVGDEAVAMYEYYDGFKQKTTSYLCHVVIEKIDTYCVFTVARTKGPVWNKDQRLAFNPESLILTALANPETTFRNGDKLFLIGDVVHTFDYVDGKAVGYSGRMLIGGSPTHAFLSPFIDGQKDPDKLSDLHHMNYGKNAGVYVVPWSECYASCDDIAYAAARLGL